MSSDNKRSDEYWMGVRDALRMVDIFTKWAARNPRRAKSLDDFIHDGLIAAAKRCESCLREKLGISFAKEERAIDVPSPVESLETEVVAPPEALPIPDEIFDARTESPPDTGLEIAVESSDSFSDQEVRVESEEPSFSIDTVERDEKEPPEDIVIEGPQRDFSTDFDLVEPPALSVDVDESELEEPEIDEQASGPGLEEYDYADEAGEESEDAGKRPGFTWADYEAAVTPAPQPELLEPGAEEFAAEDGKHEGPTLADEGAFDGQPLVEPPEPSRAPQGWTEHDESTTSGEKALGGSHDVESEVDGEIDGSTTPKLSEATAQITEPPSPPPPPESEEDEEERRRRARRLFFGT